MDCDKNPGRIPLRQGATKPLTAVAIAGMRPGAVLADGGVPPGAGRLKVRKRPTAVGVSTEWLFQYFRDGRPVRLSIGGYSATGTDGLSLAKARARAGELQAMIRAGTDPAEAIELGRQQTRATQRAAVQAGREAQQKTLAALLAAYVDDLRSRDKARSAGDAEGMFRLHVVDPFPELAGMPAAEVKPEHITRALARLVGPAVEAKRGRTALKLRSYIAAAYALALGAGTNPMAPASAAGFRLSGNPARSVSAKEMAATFNRKGERSLSPGELARYMAYVDALPSLPQRVALRLQLATGGQRIQQLLRLSVEDVSANTITLYDPKGRRVHPRKHQLPMIPEVAELIDAAKELRQSDNSALLFDADGAALHPSTLSATVHEISLAMIEAGEAASPFRGGDIRRTAETLLSGELRVSKDDRAQLLSHGLGGVQDTTYDTGDHMQAKIAALRQWNDYLAGLCIGPDKPSSNVIALRVVG